MSAIGVIFDPQGLHADELDTMLATLSQVPHNEAKVWRSGPIALAACIVHTSGQSREQSQPHVSEDGRLAAVFEGFLLNHEDLTRDLTAKGVRLANKSDVEIILRGYEVWGDGLAGRLRGEYSLAIADLRAGRLFVTRDHLGFVPLYYKQDGERLVLASDFRTIAAVSKRPLEPNPRYLAQTIANKWFLRDETPWRDVKRVVRAHTLTFDGQRLERHNYWVPPTEVTIRYKRQEEYVEHYREVLFDCVRKVSRSDRPIGVAVSGGLDSSALFSISHLLEQRGELEAPGFHGYSLAASEDGNAFELPFARAAAAYIDRPLTEVPLFDPDIDWYEQDANWHNDIAIPSNGAMMLGMEQRVVDDGSRVLINGSGGDEWLQGNAQYYREFVGEMDIAGFWQALMRDGKSLGWPTALKQASRQTVAELTPGFLRKKIRERLREYRRKNEREPVWLLPEYREMLAEAEEVYDAQLPENGVHWAKRNLLLSPFSDLTHQLMRRQRNRIGLESRHPMLSRAFIEFSLATPAHIKRKGSITKVIHRESMQGILAQEVLDRKTKANFTNVEIDQQFAAHVREHAHEQLAGICDFEGLKQVTSVDYSTPEGDFWAWEIWGLYASAAFLYQYKRVNEINPATGVQQDRNLK